MKLKLERSGDFTCVIFGKCPYHLENAHTTLNLFYNKFPFLYNSSAFLLSFFCIAQSHRLDFVLS